MANSVISVISKFIEEYASSTSAKLKLVDAYLLYILLTGAFQFLYCLLVGTFPFNSFLSGFISCVGSFILAGEYKHEQTSFFFFCLYKLFSPFPLRNNFCVFQNRKRGLMQRRILIMYRFIPSTDMVVCMCAVLILVDQVERRCWAF